MELGQISPMCCSNLKREAVIKPIANPNPSCEAWIFQDCVGSEVFKPLGEVHVFNGEGSETESIWFPLLGRRQTPKWCHCLLLPASPQMMAHSAVLHPWIKASLWVKVFWWWGQDIIHQGKYFPEDLPKPMPHLKKKIIITQFSLWASILPCPSI